MNWLGCISFGLLILAIGYAGMSALWGSQRKSLLEIVGMSFAAGAGLLAWLLFILSWAKWRPGGGVLSTLALLAAATLFTLRRRLVRIAPIEKNGSWNAQSVVGMLALAVIFISIAQLCSDVFSAKLEAVDDYAIWLLKAKIVCLQPLNPTPAAFLDPNLSYSHQDYPLGFPLLVAGMYAMADSTGPIASKIILLPIYLSLIAVMYCGLRAMVSRSVSLAITAIFVGMPVLAQHAGMAVAEMPLVLMHSACLVLLIRWMKNFDRRDMIAAGAFAAFAAFMKNEGLALLPVVLVAALIFAIARKDRRLIADWLWSVLISAALIAPWLIYRLQLPKTHEDYGDRLASISVITQNLSRLRIILPAYLGLLVQFNTASALWLILLIVAGTNRAAFNQAPVKIIWSILLTHLALYVCVLIVTPWALDVLLPMIGAKLLMHAAPAAALLIGLHLQPAVSSAPGVLAAPTTSGAFD